MWEVIAQGPKGDVKTIKCFPVEKNGETVFYRLRSPVNSVLFRNTKWTSDTNLKLSYNGGTRKYTLHFPVGEPEVLGQARMLGELTRRAGEVFASRLIQLVSTGG
jgi:hypothetical protein